MKVADFGLARKAPASGPIQTRSYRAPEVVRKKKYGTAVDIWSLGVTVISFIFFNELLFQAYLFAAGASLFRIEKVDDAKVQDREHLNKIAHICGFVYGRKQAEDEGSQNKVSSFSIFSLISGFRRLTTHLINFITYCRI